MWPGFFLNPMLPYFEGAKVTASNLPAYGEQGNYTTEMFQSDFPQFFSVSTSQEEEPTTTSLVPETILQLFVSQANDSILPSRWGALWRYAAGLYVAHYSTLYLRTYSPSSSTTQQAAATGALVGIVSSAALGDSSVSYDTNALIKGTEDWGDLNATQYGQILASQARMVGLGGMYVV